jgi:hypothetical protein
MRALGAELSGHYEQSALRVKGDGSEIGCHARERIREAPRFASCFVEEQDARAPLRTRK